MSAASLTLRFFNRELRNRFAGSFSGGLWALIQPVIQLAVYAYVFVHIFNQRVPGANAPSYVPFLVAALWPWTAFSEGVLRSTTAVQDNAALIGKVALPREVLVFASVASSFAVHLAGFIIVLLVLAVAGKGIVLAGLVPAVLLYVPLFALALGFGLLFSALQVFVRDTVSVLGQLLALLIFAAPIFYDRAVIPENLRGWLDINPFSFYADAFRAVLLDHGSIEPMRLAIALTTAALVLLAGRWTFRRLDPHFEDFL